MAHRKRNHGEYEGVLDIDPQFVAELIEAVQTVARALSDLEQSA